MYINDLGIGRAVSSDDHNNGLRTSKLAGKQNTQNYATVMKKAVESKRTSLYPTFSSVGDLIIQEAFKKMETDPEWETSVMDKVKDYYAGDLTENSVQKSYQNLMGQNSLQNMLTQSLLGGTGSLGFGMTGYSPYAFGNAAASAYGSVVNNGLSSSLFGDWML